MVCEHWAASAPNEWLENIAWWKVETNPKEVVIDQSCICNDVESVYAAVEKTNFPCVEPQTTLGPSLTT